MQQRGTATIRPRSPRAPISARRRRWQLRPDAVKADQHFSDTVTAEDGKLTVPVGAADPAGTNEALIAKLRVGTVLAGNRDTASSVLAESKNPYGFLRRVIEIQRGADAVVLHTQQAYLDELFSEGDPVWDAERPMEIHLRRDGR